MDHVFISYASGDLAKVDSFRQLLLQQSIPCWMLLMTSQPGGATPMRSQLPCAIVPAL